MIRFRCPLCAKRIKVLDEKAGIAVRCPRCKERCLVPAAASTETPEIFESDPKAPETEEAAQLIPSIWNQAKELFWEMSGRLRALILLLATISFISLLVPIVALLVPGGRTVSAWATPWAMVVVPCSIVVVLVIFYGQGTGCPSCGKWWRRVQGDTQFIDREVIEKGGVPFARARYRTTYSCATCRYRWSLEHTDEYKDFIRERLTRQELK